MKKHISIYLIILTILSWSLGKNEKSYSDSFHHQKRKRIVRFNDSTNKLSLLIENFYEEDFIWHFYPNGSVMATATTRYLYDFKESNRYPINRYNSFFYPCDYGLCGKPVYYNWYYETGEKKIELIPNRENNLKVDYLEYFKNSQIKHKRTFIHISLDSTFIPYGIWYEYDSLGVMLKEYVAPESYLPPEPVF